MRLVGQQHELDERTAAKVEAYVWDPFFPHIDFQPRAQIKRLFEESELVSGDREAIRKFSDKYIVPEKLVAEHVEHLIQIKMRKEKKKEETETEQMERLNREYNDLASGDREAIRNFSDKYIVPEKLVAEHVEHLIQIKMRKEKKKEETETEQMERLNREYNDLDWVGLYNSDKLSSLRVDELSLYFSHHKITFKGKKAARVAMIKAHIGSLLYDSMECQQPRQPLQGNLQQQVTSSLSEVETDSQSDVVDRVVGSSLSSWSDESSPETNFIPEPARKHYRHQNIYGRKWARVEKYDYVSWGR